MRFCCYGKKSYKSISFAWNDLNSALSTLTKKKPIYKKHEQRSRLILENLLHAPFTSIRPNFLKYHTGKNLELDGYNPELNVAFEYQGIQHRQFTPMFHKRYLDFDKQVQRDTWKHNKCKELGIKLLCIPDTIHFDDLDEYIKNWCQEQELI
jgi:hypothetical protein